ncbi:MAG TPA: hypothetical protein VII75_16175 [Thermoanaerobaculia bacterium]|nr:hypothetical protein [Thermoanaerobaculia bacterium]
MVLARLSLLALLFGTACTVFVPLHAFRLAEQNQQHVDRIRLGQTLSEVERVMGHPPERRSTRRRFDGLSIEEWSYLTDYIHKSDTTITFVGGKVDEIRVVPWQEKD